MTMQDLKITKKDAKGDKNVVPSNHQESYSYGMRLDLDENTLKKLGIKKLPAVGDVLMFEAKAKVIASRQSYTVGGTNRSLELQVTHMDLEMDSDEVPEGELTRGQSGAISKVAQKMRDM